MEKQYQKTAMVLLTGYLGSGKTTLISYILKEQNTYKVAVVQNEFADEMGIESPLMQDSEGKPFDKFYELPNGCICCTAKDDLLTAVEYLIQNEKQKLDFILVETNGLADPSSTIKSFWVDENIDFPAELRAIHTVVPVHRYEQLKNDQIFQRQILYADNILLNQIDKSNEEEIQNVEKQIHQLNPIAKFERSSYCKIDLNRIFEIDGFNLRKTKSEVIEILNKISQEHEHDHVHAEGDIQYQFFEYATNPFDEQQLEIKLGELLWENEKIKVLRMKGLINIKDDDFMYSLQGVEDIFEIKKTDVMWPDIQQRKSKFLFICQNATKQELIDIITK
ncbi:hypothetical protein ABPG72_010287 [Tetrahymena utriculariae]